ncbi:hypothetical protein QYE76_048794 [Lolium multiflorum]|uniref:Uncharacterized protein n=1 Tax=Lolium multiflorum TaxID=4521 RepID=A0AAD8SMK4_LOLMU|nr:hypothetical protein QYE76_048794 [Lolium multiflorum]
MLRACVLEYGSKWEDCLPYAEFSYNNSYQASLQMAPLKPVRKEMPYPLNWSEVGESQFFGPDVLREAEERVHKIREYLKTAQSRQKSYADKRRRGMTFEIGDFVYLKETLPLARNPHAPTRPRRPERARTCPWTRQDAAVPRRLAVDPATSQTSPIGRGPAVDDALVSDRPPPYCQDARTMTKRLSLLWPRHDARQPRLDVTNTPRPSLSPSPPWNDDAIDDLPAPPRPPPRPINRGILRSI